MLKVALTGNAASGKSTVAAIWRESGVPVVSADDLAREAVEPGTPALRRILETFGDEVLAADGTLDRARMRRIVFSDPDARRRLEEIVHPVVRLLRDRWMTARAAEGHRLAVAEIPLLYETGGERDFDLVVFVDAPEHVRLERLIAHRGLDEPGARALMASQLDPVDKRGRADRILENDADRDTLNQRAGDLLEDLRIRAEKEGAVAGPEAAPPPPGWMRLDLHLHTLGSWDCLSDPVEVLERAAVRGVERIAVTDHDRIGVARRLAELHPDRVIPGEEVRSAEGIDVIGLYLTEEIPRGTPAREVCARIRDQGGIAYLPHPYARGKGGSGRMAEELAPLVEVVEVFNARLHPGRLNEPALALALRHDRLCGAGSDAHTVDEVAGAYVEVPRHANLPDALRVALGSGRVRGRTASNLVHLASTWAKLRRRVAGAPSAWSSANPSGE